MTAMDAAALSNVFTENATIYDPVGTPEKKVEDIAKFIQILAGALDKLALIREQTFIVSNGAAIEWTMQALGKNGQQATAQGITTLQVSESGKIQSLCSYWDESQWVAQLRS